MTDYKPLETCLACGHVKLVKYLDLGDQPLANEYTAAPISRVKYPLGLQYCLGCYHSQNLIAVDPDLIYRDYPYVSGTSATLGRYFEDFVSMVERDFPDTLCPLRVLDIASNDGTLLKAFRTAGHHIQGVDPARNLVTKAIADGVPTLSDYWSEHALDYIIHHECKSANKTNHFDVVIAMNVLGHVADPLTFLKLCKRALAPGGRIYVQTSQAMMLRNYEFDTVYHEHLSFFTVNSFMSLAARAGLVVENISHVPVHGTSYVVELVEPYDGGEWFEDIEQSALGCQEIGDAYYRPETYEGFALSANITANWLMSTATFYRAKGPVVAYGASAKAMTMLNYACVTPDLIFDDNPLKHERYSSCGAMVVPPDERLKELPDALFIVGAWNMKAEIKAKIKAARPDKDDRFLTWFPTQVLDT